MKLKSCQVLSQNVCVHIELLKPEVDRQLQEMIALQLIAPSTSDMASPLVCVMKGPTGQDGVRLAVDYRHVNMHSAGDSYPTPDVSDVLQKVGRSSYISCFDAKNGYWQLPMKESSVKWTEFTCPRGYSSFRGSHLV